MNTEEETFHPLLPWFLFLRYESNEMAYQVQYAEKKIVFVHILLEICLQDMYTGFGIEKKERKKENNNNNNAK